MELQEFSETDLAVINKAFELRNADKLESALELFLSMEIYYPENRKITFMIGICYSELEDYKNSERYFKKTTLLNPKSELASLGLFHSLMNQKKYREAFREINNFLAKNEPENYKITLEELNETKDTNPQYVNKIVEKYIDKYMR